MADDITKFTNLKSLIEQIQNGDPYYKLNYKLSKQKIRGLKGWSPEEKQVLKNMKKHMSTEEFLGIKDIDKFDFNKYLDTTPKPAVNGTAPETKPAVDGTATETKPATNSTIPETKPANGTVPETKPGFWTRMTSRWTPGIGQLPSAEAVGIKQPGKLKSINPFYGFTEAATRQGMYEKAIAEAKKAGYRNGGIPEELKNKILNTGDAKITTGAKIKHGLLSNLKAGAIGALVGSVTDAFSPKDTGADEMQNIYGGWGTTGKGLGYASYLTPGVAPFKIGFDAGDAVLHKYYGEDDEAGTGVVRDIVHLGSKWDELGNMLRRGVDQYSNWFSGKGSLLNKRDDPATVGDDIRTLSQRAASYPSLPQDYVDANRSAELTAFTSGVHSKPLNGIDYNRDIDTSKFTSPYQEPGIITKQQMHDGYLTLPDQLRRRGIVLNGKGFFGDFLRYLNNVAPEAFGKLDYHRTNLTKSSYLLGKDGEQIYTTPYMLNKDAVQAFFNDPRVKASGKYSDAEISDILSKMNEDAIRYD